MIRIRAAHIEDAVAMAELRAASIRHLCSADHQGDPVSIADWIGSPDKFVHLIERPDQKLIVTEVEGKLAGLGGLSEDMVTLNYVHPDFRFRGVSKAIMQALEDMLRRDGVTTGRLTSSATALRFYNSIGWLDAGDFDPDNGQPMVKRL